MAAADPQRGVDICSWQSSWSAAVAVRGDGPPEVFRQPLWSRREVEARPSSAWAEPTSSVCRP